MRRQMFSFSIREISVISSAIRPVTKLFLSRISALKERTKLDLKRSSGGKLEGDVTSFKKCSVEYAWLADRQNVVQRFFSIYSFI